MNALFKPGKVAFSVEMFPPKGQLTLDAARNVVDGMAQAAPDFISVTCSAGGSGNSAQTVDIASLIQHEAGISSVAHMTCVSATSDSIDAEIERMRELGVQSVLALRGDLVNGQDPGDFKLAIDLIPILKDAGFTVGAAAYAEGHVSCFDPSKNIEHLKAKQDAGADFFVTQLCFDNEAFYRFLDEADKAGIVAPITCGVMPFLGRSQVERMIFMCGSSLPAPVVKLLAKHEGDEKALRQAGVEYACGQIVDLAQSGVDGVHVYAMNHPDIAWAASRALADKGIR